MFKLGNWFVFKSGSGIKAVPMQVKVITKDGKRIRTYRAIDGEMWIDVNKLRLATKQEIKLQKRIDEEAP